MFSTFSNFIGSTVNKISNPETTENYEYTTDFNKDFDHIIDKYHQKFEEKNLLLQIVKMVFCICIIWSNRWNVN